MAFAKEKVVLVIAKQHVVKLFTFFDQVNVCLCPGCSEGKWEGGQPASACPILSTSMSDNLSQQEICAMFTKDENGCLFTLKAVLSILKKMKNKTYSKRSEDQHTFSRLPLMLF